jgi:hypothetical protein
MQGCNRDKTNSMKIASNDVVKHKGLSDKELSEKYDTGRKVNFVAGIKKMLKAPSPTTLSKGKK